MSQVTVQTDHSLDIDNIRKDFPILNQTLYSNKPLVYFDSAATSQKPRQVIDALVSYYENDNANVHRGIHALAHRATLAFEATRMKLQQYIKAADKSEIIFTSGTTEAINLVAQTWGPANLKSGDAILLTEMEHHSNLVPWQMLAQKTGCQLRFIPVDESGQLDLSRLDDYFTDKVKLVAVTHMSNVLGTINPIKKLAEYAHARQSLILVDGAQGAPHITLDVQDLDVDFYTISGHKMLGPTGVGALYARKEILEEMPPYKGGGEMIDKVSYDGFTFGALPQKFEAGTPNIAAVIAFSEAIDYINAIGLNAIHAHEVALTEYAIAQLEAIPGIKIYGHAPERGGVVTFNINSVHPLDLTQLLDREGFAIRTGHHCAQPLMAKLGVESSARISFYIYNTFTEIDRFMDGFDKVLKMLR
jgi:cysteine desulfurase/selenocysteine lyase